MWRGNVVPSLENAANLARRSFDAGDVSYLLVLEARRKVLEARMRRAELSAQLRHSTAELNYSVGMKVI